jgi:uncharacterized membrane protein
MLATSAYMFVFRLIHITAGVAWAGSVFLLVVFVQPSAAAIAPAGAPFMSELLGGRRLIDRIIGIGTATVVAGLFLYWHDWHAYGGFGNWVTSAFGAVISIGMVAAIGALAIGVAGTRPTVERFLALGRAAADAGGPTPEQLREMGRLQARLKVYARASLGLLAIAVFCMATARYW